MSNLKRYDLVLCSDSDVWEVMDSPAGRYVKFDDIKDLRSSIDVQQLKPKMPTLVELYPWINESTDGFQSGANAIYERMCQHFGH